MAKTVNNVKIQLRRDTSANWLTNNPVLRQGEIGYDSTVKKIKAGDGTTAWNSLPYIGDLDFDAIAAGLQFEGTRGTVTVKGTPSGSITIAANNSGYQITGTVSQPTFSNGLVSATGKFTPEGSVTVGTTTSTTTVSKASSGEATYTPEGSVRAPTINVSSAGATSSAATGLASAAPGFTAPSNATTYYSYQNGNLKLYQLGYNTSSFKTGDASYTATAPRFTGTGARLVTGNITTPTGSGSFSGTEGDISVSGTASGTISQPTFTGGKIGATFGGNELTSTGSYTPAGSITKVTSGV